MSPPRWFALSLLLGLGGCLPTATLPPADDDDSALDDPGLPAHCAAAADPLRVGVGPWTDFPDLTAALDAVDAGTLCLETGYYAEQLRFEERHDLVILSQPDASLDPGAGPAIQMTGGTVDILGLRLSGGSGIALQGGVLTLQELDFGDTTGPLAVVEAGSLTLRGVRAGQGEGLRLDGGQLVLEEATLADLRGPALEVRGGTLELSQVTIREPGGSGLTLSGDGVVTADQLAIGEPGQPGVVQSGGSLDCTGCTVDEAPFAAVVLLGGELTWTGGALADSRIAADQGGGIGVYAAAGSARLEQMAIGGQRGPGVVLADGGAWTLRELTLDGALSHPLAPAILAYPGNTAWDGATGLTIEDCTLSGNGAVGILLHGAAATLMGNDFSGLSSESPVVQQACAETPAVEGDLTVACGDTSWPVEPRPSWP